MSDTPDPQGEPFAGLQQKLGEDVMRALLAMPAVLEGQLEGSEGPYAVPPEEFARAAAELAPKLLIHLQAIAGAVDLTRGELVQLRARVEALERQLDPQ